MTRALASQFVDGLPRALAGPRVARLSGLLFRQREQLRYRSQLYLPRDFYVVLQQPRHATDGRDLRRSRSPPSGRKASANLGLAGGERKVDHPATADGPKKQTPAGCSCSWRCRLPWLGSSRGRPRGAASSSLARWRGRAFRVGWTTATPRGAQHVRVPHNCLDKLMCTTRPSRRLPPTRSCRRRARGRGWARCPR